MAAIYKITNLINNKIYIGMTTKSIEQRFKNHLENKNTIKLQKYAIYRALNKYGKENFKVDSIIEGDFNQCLLSDLEKHYIRLYNSNNPNIGYNMNGGGDGGIMYIRTEEIKNKISKTLMGHSNNKGIKKSEEHKLKLKEANLRILREGYRLPFKKYVYQFDLDMNFIKRFDSKKEAIKELKVGQTAMDRIAKNITKNPRCGFKFIITKEVLDVQ